MTNYSQLKDLLETNRRSGSTTALVEASNQNPDSVLIVHTESMRQDLIQGYGADPKRVRVAGRDHRGFRFGPILVDNVVVIDILYQNQSLVEEVDILKGSLETFKQKDLQQEDEIRRLKSEVLNYQLQMTLIEQKTEKLNGELNKAYEDTKRVEDKMNFLVKKTEDIIKKSGLG